MTNPDPAHNTFIHDCRGLAYKADRIHRWIREWFLRSSIPRQSYAFKDRLKNAHNIREKVLARRNQGKPTYSLSEVTDASGFRIVRLFNAEVPEALNELLE